MSSASPFRRTGSRQLPRQGIERLERLAVGTARTAGFWSAIVIPFVLLGLVVAGSAAENAALFAGLVAANALALKLGHGHRR